VSCWHSKCGLPGTLWRRKAFSTEQWLCKLAINKNSNRKAFCCYPSDVSMGNSVFTFIGANVLLECIWMDFIIKRILFCSLISRLDSKKLTDLNCRYFLVPLQEYLLDLANDPVRSRFCKQRVLCRTLAGQYAVRNLKQCTLIKSGISKLRHAGQVRPAKTFLSITKT